MERFGGLVIRDDDDRRGSGRADEVRKVECTRSCSESGHTTASRSSAQMAAYTLEGFRVFKVREDFTDEGKNHSSVILVELVPALVKQE
jgi:hypothetical protein